MLCEDPQRFRGSIGLRRWTAFASVLIGWSSNVHAQADSLLFWDPVTTSSHCVEHAACVSRDGSDAPGNGARVFVPVQDGEILRSDHGGGNDVGVPERGLAFGPTPAQSIVLWLPSRSEGDPNVLAVPFASRASFAVFRSADPFRILRLRRRVDQQAVRRSWSQLTFRDGAENATASDSREVGEPAWPAATLDRVVRETLALREALPSLSQEATSHYATARYLELTAQHEPLREPFFAKANETHLRLAQGEALPLSTGEVHSLKIRTRVGVPSRVDVLRAGVLIRSERFSGSEGPAPGGRGFSKFRLFRVTGDDVRLEVAEGDIEVVGASYRFRGRVIESLQGQTPAASFEDGALARELRRAGSRMPSGPALQSLLLALSSTDQEARDRHAVAALQGRLPAGFALRLAQRYWDIQRSAPTQVCSLASNVAIATGSADSKYSAADADAFQLLTSILCWRNVSQSVAQVTRLARRIPEDPLYAGIAREVLRRSLRFQASPNTGTGLQVELPPPLAGAGGGADEDRLCPRSGSAGFRWRVLPPGRHRARLTRGTRNGLRVRVASQHSTADGFSPWQGVIRVNGVPLTVHGPSGLESAIDTRPGLLEMEIPFGAPELLVRLPYADAFPCAALRDVYEERPIGAGVSLSLRPLRFGKGSLRAGSGPSAVSVARAALDWRIEPSLRAAESPGVWRRFRVTAGRQVFSVETAPQFSRGSLELSLLPRTQRISIRPVEATARDTVHLRLAMIREAASGAFPQGADEEPEASQDELLAQVWNSSAVLRQDQSAREARERRATALWRLGQRGPSRVDYGVLEASPPDTRRPVRGEALAEGELQTNWLGRMALLPVEDRDGLREARSLVARGQLESALELLNGGEPNLDGELRTVEQLLAANILARLERPADAAEVLARLEDPAAYERAAQLLYTAALAELEHGRRDERKILAALSYAAYAHQAGASVDSILARILGWIRWQVPAASSSAGGTRFVTRDPNERETGLRGRVHRALLGAPDDAMLLRAGEWMESEWRVRQPVGLTVRSGCLSLDTLAPCEVEVFIDGTPVSLGTPITLPTGTRRLEVRPPETSVAWFQLSGANVPRPVTRSLYYEVVPETPLRFSVAGASVLRLETTEPDAELAVWVDGSRIDAFETEPGRVVAAIPALPDSRVIRHIEVRSEARRLVRPQLAMMSDRLASPVPLTIVDPAPSELPPLDPAFRTPAASDVIPAGPFSARFSMKGAFREIRDLDVFTDGTPYLELRPELMYRSPTSDYRLLVAALVRTRAGPPSYGARLQFALASDGYRPGLLLNAHLMAQELDTHQLGFEGSATALFPIFRDSRIRLVAAGGVTAFAVRQPEAGQQGVDPDVFSRFARDHPIYGRFALLMSSRPFLDFMARGQLSVQSNADFVSIDRFGGSIQVDWFPGAGYAPWLTLGYEGSYRVADEFRPDPVGRHILFAQAALWGWLVQDGRLGLSGELQWILDRQEFAGFLALEYLWSPRRGVHDLSRQETPYRERLEEGAVVADELRRPVGVLRPYSLSD